ncbi:MAG: GerMN domain-containing protein [Candidatus Yonathbacteria bacterium]|nr:GerMN domain-containing protein [Candidatus Yonathbacteria bacterium]
MRRILSSATLIGLLLPSMLFAQTANTMEVTIVLVDPEAALTRAVDTTAGEIKNDFGDILVPVTRTVPYSKGVLKSALTELFTYKESFIGQSGLYTALANNTISVAPTTFVRDGVAHIDLKGALRIGGIGDMARYHEQVAETAKANAKGVRTVHVTLNGKFSAWMVFSNGRGWTDPREPKALDALYTALRKNAGLNGYRFALTTLGLPTIENNVLTIDMNGKFVRVKPKARLDTNKFLRSLATSLKKTYRLTRVTFMFNGQPKTY